MKSVEDEIEEEMSSVEEEFINWTLQLKLLNYFFIEVDVT